MLKKSAKLLSVILVVVMLSALFAGCSQKPAEEGSKGTEQQGEQQGKKNYKFGLSIKNATNPFYLTVRDNIQSSLKEGDELITLDADNNQAKQLNDIEDLIQQGVDALFVMCIDWKGIKPALEAAQKAGIPFIAVDSPVYDADLATTTVASDNYQAGVLIGEALVEHIGGKGEVVMYENTTSSPSKQRADGFESVIAKYPDIKIVNRQNGAGKIELALPAMENMLQANPDIVGVFAINDPAAQGCIAAIEAAGKINQIAVVGVDGADESKKLIKEGKQLASAAQFPDKIGQYAADAAYKILAGEKVDKEIKVPVELITKENVDQYMK